MEIRDNELRYGKADSGGEGCWPNAKHTAKSRHGTDDPERNEQRKERQLATDHFGEGQFVDARYALQGDDRGAKRAKGHGCRIGDERQSRGSQRLKAQLDQHCGRHSDRRTESCGTFEECTEGEGNQDHLDARIRRNSSQAAAQDIEQSFLNRELIEKDEVENDPADGEKPVTCAVKRGGQGGC